MKFSLIIPVYNRPEEADELLASLATQTRGGFEVIVVEDGSADKSDIVVSNYREAGLDVRYFFKPNSGPGPSRNYGAERSNGEYLIFLDSDCIIPPGYIAELERELADSPTDAFGGPDRADDSFTTVQKAIDYAMTSFLTTGGIRGGKRKMDVFYPRSFNMGVRREVFAALGGFAPIRFGEDIDLSLRIVRGGYTSRLFPGAWVCHKRRTDFRKFFRQVYNFGMARVATAKRHPGSLKAVHALPAVFTLGCAAIVIASAFLPALLLLPVAYALAVLADASVRTKSLKVGAVAVAASFVQLTGYGLGFLAGIWKIYILRREKYFAFSKTFYK